MTIEMSAARSSNMNQVASELVAELIDEPGTTVDWADRYRRVLDPDAPTRLHLAVFVEPYLGWILDGSKTVESRFSAVRCAPWNAVNTGDIVLMKQMSGPVVGVFVISSVTSYTIASGVLDLIRELFGDAIRPEEEDFWDQRGHAKYATLMSIADQYHITPTPIPKRDRRGWVVLETESIQGSLLYDL